MFRRWGRFAKAWVLLKPPKPPEPPKPLLSILRLPSPPVCFCGTWRRFSLTRSWGSVLYVARKSVVLGAPVAPYTIVVWGVPTPHEPAAQFQSVIPAFFSQFSGFHFQAVPDDAQLERSSRAGG
jgi:hypothetical protein